MSEIGKRDKRNPGHCWQDNELYDVFQPVIGALPAHVFAVMTRFCYGHEVRIGLRELAEEAGVSRSTVHRATLAMQALAMIRITEGRGRGSAAYELLDLKESARALGAQWDPRRASRVLNAAQVRELKKRVSAALDHPSDLDLSPGNPKAACVPVRDAKEEAVEGDSVPVRDATPCGNHPVVSHVVSQNRGVCVPNSGVPLIRQDTKTQKQTHPVVPPASGTGRGVLDDSRLSLCAEAARDRVCRECDLADERQQRKIAKAIAQYACKAHLSADQVATAMVEAWSEYCAAMPMLRFRWGPVKFFTLGHWRNADSWPWDEQLIERERMARQARVGVA